MAFGGENAESYYDEGLTALVRGDVPRAVKCFQKAIRLDPAFIAARHQLGKCYVRLGQTQEAIEILSNVLTHKPGAVQVRLDLGHALLQGDHCEQAKQQFVAVLHQDPKNGRAHFGMALVHYRCKDWERSVAAAQAARVYSGPSFSILFLLGRAAKQAGNTVLAIDSLKEADMIIEQSAELDPDSPEVHYLRGEICFLQDQMSAALDHFRAAEDRTESGKVYSAFGQVFSQIDILAQRGLCLQRLGNVEGARSIGEKIVAGSPDHPVGRALSNL